MKRSARISLNALFSFMIAFAVIAVSVPVFASDKTPYKYNGTSTKFALKVSDAHHFRLALDTAETLRVKENHYKFEIIVVSKLAKELIDEPSLKPDIDRASALGVEIVVCEIAIKNNGGNKEKLDKRIRTVPSAAIHLFELKDKGFNTL